MSSLKTKFFLFSNLIVILTAIITTTVSVYMYHSGLIKNISQLEYNFEKQELDSIKSEIKLLEKMLDDYLNGLKIIIDHLSKISLNMYKENKEEKILIFSPKGKLLFSPDPEDKKNSSYKDYFKSNYLQKKLEKFFTNYYKGSELSLVTNKKIIYLKSLKNFPYVIIVVNNSKNAQLIESLKKKREEAYKNGIKLIALITLVLVVIIAILLKFFSKPYFQLIDNSIKIFEDFSKGNLKVINEYLRIFDTFKDREIQLVKEGFLKMKEGIGSLILNLQSMSNDINQSSTEVQQNLNSILERLTESNQTMADQLKTTETISASLIEIEKAVSEIKDYAKKNKDVAEENYNKALKGYNSIKNLMNWLNQISELSKKIDDVINIINDVSKKTKLLSLNASIEASKAGEHGKGFSIVAEEIRKLADSTRSSTGEIFEHLTLINTKIDEGMSISEEIYKNLDEIRDSASKNKEDSERVAVAIEQQYTSLTLISDNIIKYNEIAEINNKNFESIISSLEQLEATAKSFSEMAEELDNLMKIFKV